MTYNEFLTGEYWREVPGFPDYLINNKGEVLSKNKKHKLAICYYGKTAVYSFHSRKTRKVKSVWKLLLEAFPDVDFSETEIAQAKCATKGIRGAYLWKCRHKEGARKTKRKYIDGICWRSLIKYESKIITIGYFATKEEALMAYYSTFLMLRGFKPWRD